MQSKKDSVFGKLLPLIAALLAVIGASVILYPQAAQWFSQLRQSRIVNAYSQELKTVQPSETVQVQNAKHYNDLLAKGVLIDIAGRKPTIREEAANIRTPEGFGIPSYEKQLLVDSSGLMGRIKVPAAEVDLPIYHGTSDSALLKGAGHLQGTALPVGGIGNRTVVTAHRGLANAAMFTHLDRVKKGDEFTLEVFGQVLVYRVFEVKVIEPTEVETITADKEKDLATLITCTPLGINTQRIVVTGERIMPTPVSALDSANSASELPHFPWWAVLFVAACILSIAFYFFARPRKASGKEKLQHPEENPEISNLTGHCSSAAPTTADFMKE